MKQVFLLLAIISSSMFAYSAGNAVGLVLSLEDNGPCARGARHCPGEDDDPASYLSCPGPSTCTESACDKRQVLWSQGEFLVCWCESDPVTEPSSQYDYPCGAYVDLNFDPPVAACNLSALCSPSSWRCEDHHAHANGCVSCLCKER
jgi:hypothetical protein